MPDNTSEDRLPQWIKGNCPRCGKPERPEASHIDPTAELVELVANKIRRSFNQPAPIPWADYQKMAMAAITAIAIIKGEDHDQ